MKRFIEGENRQATLLPDSLEDYVVEANAVRVVEVFIEDLDLGAVALPALCRKRRGGLPIIPRRG